MVEKVREIVAIDVNFTVRMLPEELNSSYCAIYIILTEDLGKRKVCARFVPHQLNAPPHKTKNVNEFLMKKRFLSSTTLRIRLIYHLGLFSISKTENQDERSILWWYPSHSSSRNLGSEEHSYKWHKKIYACAGWSFQTLYWV